MQGHIDNKSLLVEGRDTINRKKPVIIQAGMDLNTLEPEEPENKSDLTAILLDCQVDPTKTIAEPPSVIEITSGGIVVPAFTLGNFSMIIGKAKSRKTFLLTCLTSAVISGGLILDNIQGRLANDKRMVLYFDTEQGPYHLSRTLNGICRLSGIKNPENLKAYGLRKFSPLKRLELIEFAIYTNSGIGLVVIDGLRDLLTRGINDEGEATLLSSKLLKWTAERNIHIIQVLHENKMDNNARGHVGTECMNKAETTIRLTISPLDPEISIVDCVYSRDISFVPFAFKIGETGLPECCEIPVKTASVKQCKNPDKISDELHFLVLGKIFKVQLGYMYQELWVAIKTTFADQGVNFGDSKSKDYIKYYLHKTWIIQDVVKKVYQDNRSVQSTGLV